jgi:hypothetical protein
LKGYIACAQAVRDMDRRELLSKINAPTLIIGEVGGLLGVEQLAPR